MLRFAPCALSLDFFSTRARVGPPRGGNSVEFLSTKQQSFFGDSWSFDRHPWSAVPGAADERLGADDEALSPCGLGNNDVADNALRFLEDPLRGLAARFPVWIAVVCAASLLCDAADAPALRAQQPP